MTRPSPSYSAATVTAAVTAAARLLADAGVDTTDRAAAADALARTATNVGADHIVAALARTNEIREVDAVLAAAALSPEPDLINVPLTRAELESVLAGAVACVDIPDDRTGKVVAVVHVRLAREPQ